MRATTQENLISGEQIARERERLIRSGAPDDSEEFRALDARIEERDAILFERFGREFLASHPGRWIAISLDGHTVLGKTAAEAMWAGSRAFGDGNFALRKLSDVPGHRFH